MCKLNTKARRIEKARLWAERNAIDLNDWPGGIEDFAEALNQ